MRIVPADGRTVMLEIFSSNNQARVRRMICGMLTLATAAVYLPVMHHEFVNYDDPDYVYENPMVRSGLTWRGIGWAFSNHYLPMWHPLTWISHMLDWQIFGANPGGHHAINVLFHIANAILLFVVLDRMTGALWRSAIVAGLFALHPLHVESVAWASERKDTLSAFFFMLTIWLYAGYVNRPTIGRRVGVVFAFALGLLCKAMVVTLPFVLLLLDFWPLRRVSGFRISNPETDSSPEGSRRLRWSALILEKWPLFLLSLAASITAYWIQNGGGSVSTAADSSAYPSSGISNALISYVRYLRKMAWPDDLAVFYPRQAWPLWQVAGAAVLLLVLLAITLKVANRRPYLLMGWLWYLGMLVPVIGLVPIGAHAMADRYTYLPLIGVFIAVVWVAADLAASIRQGRLAIVGAGIILALCVYGAEVQLQYWKDSLALFSHSLSVTPNNYLSHNQYATALSAAGRLPEALAHYQEAARLAPENALVQDNLGTMLSRMGNLEAAIPHFREAIRLRPDFASAYCNLGVTLAGQNQLDEAITNFNRALEINPDDAKAHNNLGVALARQRKYDQAAVHYEQAYRLGLTEPEICLGLATSLVKVGRRQDAIRWFSEAVRLKPDDTQARFLLGTDLVDLGQITPGIEQLREAIRLRPDWPKPLEALAWILATDDNERNRNGAEAVRLAEKANELTAGKDMATLNALSAAYAEAGRFQEAVDTAGKALAIAQSAGDTNFAARIQAGLQLYKAHLPFRRSPRSG